MVKAAVAVALLLAGNSDAFSSGSVAFVGSTSGHQTRQQRAPSQLMAVTDVASEEVFDQTVSSASGLVVVDYSTTWCGPCKVIAPKFDELSEKYPDAVFLKVIGDASPEASKLMKREGVRSVPSFHYFVNGEKVDVVNGANAEAIEAAITKHAKAAA